MSHQTEHLTVPSRLTKNFNDPFLLFSTWYYWLKLTKRNSNDLVTYIGVVNHECGKFRLSALTEDQFRRFISMNGIQSWSHSELRTRLLEKIEQQLDTALKRFLDKC